MAFKVQLTEEEAAALKERAEIEGISMQEAARKAVREFLRRAAHQDRVADAAGKVMDRHADALHRLGE